MSENDPPRPTPLVRMSRSLPAHSFADETGIEGRPRHDSATSNHRSRTGTFDAEVERVSSEPVRVSEKDAAKLRRSIDVFDLDLVKRRDRRPKASLGWMESKGRERVKKVVMNVLLFPLHLSWWRRRVASSRPYLYRMAGLYICHAFSIVREVMRSPTQTPVEFIELMMPLLLLIVMSILMGQAAASMMAPPAPKTHVPTPPNEREASATPSPSRSEGYKMRKLARRSSKSEASSVNNDSTNEIFTNEEDMGETGSSSDDSDSSETSSDSSNESDGRKHRPHVAVRRSSLLGVGPVPQHLGAPVGQPSPQAGFGVSAANVRLNGVSPKRTEKGLPPLPPGNDKSVSPRNNGQAVSPQHATSKKQKRKQRHFFPARLVGGRHSSPQVQENRVDPVADVKPITVDADSDTDDEEDADMMSAHGGDLNQTGDSIPGGLQRSRLFSHSMEDLLDAVKSVHWSVHGPEKVLLTPGQIRAELERKVFEARISDTYRHLAPAGAFAVAFAPIGYRLWLFGGTLYCRIVELPLVSEILTTPSTCSTPGDFASFIQEVSHLGMHVFGTNLLDVTGVLTSFVASFTMAWILLGHVAGAVETFKRRYMYAKYFSKLTSSRKARRAGLPYFRLHKVDHIKVWLSLRSRRSDLDRECIGPYRASDTIAHFLFMVAIFLVGVVAFRAMQNLSGGSSSKQPGVMLSTMADWVLGVWALILAIYVQRIMALASKTHERFMDISVLLTEELNIHMRLLRKPEKKDELNACNQMLKVASSLIKELEGGKSKKGQGGALVLDPWLYSIVRVVLLSALGALSSDLFGFRVRFWKI